MSPMWRNILTLFLLFRDAKEEEEPSAQVAEDNTVCPNVRDEEAGLDNSAQGSTAGKMKLGDGKHQSTHMDYKTIERVHKPKAWQ